ncbi:hypothetical protein CDAR_228341 [Caerostris darwini]|uniref:Uncharacterized protein n=1 Tax=Caerostris darwini TaxID=1538125 RepID=A0AAV4N6B7_9ARAC|nr:hypothetical protein CDAR_228341 [Caerostris darwini]
MQHRRFTRGSTENYKMARRIEKTIYKWKKRLFLEYLLKNIEHLRGSNESRTIYKLINNSRIDFKFRITFCSNRDCRFRSDLINVSNRWNILVANLMLTNINARFVNPTKSDGHSDAFIYVRRG